MSFLQDLGGLNPSKTFTLMMLVLGLVAPGILVIYVFHPDLFFQLNIGKLLLLAIAITIPFYAINIYVGYRAAKNRTDSTEHTSLGNMYVGAIYTVYVFYPVLLLGYLVTIPFKLLLGVLIIWQIFMIWHSWK